MPHSRHTRVLIVDDSAVVRRILTQTLAAEPDIEVVGAAPDPYIARDKILALLPDVLTLDLEMPRMDGLTFLRKLMQFHPMPVVVISSLTQRSCGAAMQALELGAVEVLAKPGGPHSVAQLRQTLGSKIRAALAARFPIPIPAPVRSVQAFQSAPCPSGRVLAIGASTGGTEAIASILARMPANTPPILVVQHIPAGFSRAFAARLNSLSPMDVCEAQDGAALRPGLVLVAPGDFHMTLHSAGAGYFVRLRRDPPVCYQRPSVDVMFDSVARVAGKSAVALLLTGMGKDGAEGLLRLRLTGAATIAQDEATSVIYGMPREAARLGAAGQVLPLGEIPAAMYDCAYREDYSLQRNSALPGFEQAPEPH